MPRVAAIVVAGGSGERFGAQGGKQLAELQGRPVVAHSVVAVASARSVAEVIVVCHPDRVEEYRDALSGLAVDASLDFVAGGDTRQASVAAGLAALPADTAVVAIHDGARPLVPHALTERAIEALAQDPALAGVVVGHASSDTIKLTDGELIIETPDRARLWAVQTPQVFRVEPLRRAFAAAEHDGFLGTDDASLVERIGEQVRLIEGPADNIKVTRPEDIAIAEAVLAWRRSQGA